MLTCLHGFAEDDTVWPCVLAGCVAARGVLLPGHGGAPWPAGLTFAGLAARLAEELSSPAQEPSHAPPHAPDLLGYSFGGRLALGVACHLAARPDSLRHLRRLILISAHAGLAEPERSQRAARDARQADSLESDGIGPFVAAFETVPALRPARPLASPITAATRALRLSQDPRALAAALRACGPGTMPDLRPLLPHVHIPVLVIAGAEDAAYTAHARDLVARLPQAHLHLLPACGHAPHREAPHALRQVVGEFLAEQ